MKKPIISFLYILTAFISCTQTLEKEEFSDFEVDTPNLVLATFGEQTGHPFSMENALRAYGNLPIETRASFSEEAIEPTHLYIRFMPSNEEELWNVKQQKDLDVFQYPLDCEVTEGFVGIDNPFLLNGFPQLWVVVPADYPISEIACPYEVESELWMPDFNSSAVKSDSSMDILDFYEDLMKELCYEQNLTDEFCGPETKSSTTYYPGGIIKYVDTTHGETPLYGMQVEAYTFWHNYKTTSLVSGTLNFGGKTFSGSFRYRAKFSLDDFAIRTEDNKSDLEYVTEKTTKPFYMTFSGAYSKYCVVFAAAHRYYYQSISIPRPPQNGFWKACLRIHVYPNDSGDYLGVFTKDRRGLLADRPEISIYGYSSSSERYSDELYATTIHELTHAMHYNLNKDLFYSIENSVVESLARGVQLYLTKMKYPSYSMHSGYYNINCYTGFMRDLTDSRKTVYCSYYEDFSSVHYSPSKTYYDNVDCAYTYPELVEAVKTCKTPEEWVTRIKTLYPGRVSASDLDSVYNFWFVE